MVIHAKENVWLDAKDKRQPSKLKRNSRNGKNIRPGDDRKTKDSSFSLKTVLGSRDFSSSTSLDSFYKIEVELWRK
ncbi:hypothetical protein HZH66_004658 [Vespula vulgaris]|uniref:Uncharacterized protein n=1 Tax=Vespula vulgaris TaxID=7454 RepID=A0A834KEE1_VESVU|nr:hypothetical protein HZH66_004658 [Vespula vulgaris]